MQLKIKITMLIIPFFSINSFAANSENCLRQLNQPLNFITGTMLGSSGVYFDENGEIKDIDSLVKKRTKNRNIENLQINVTKATAAGGMFSKVELQTHKYNLEVNRNNKFVKSVKILESNGKKYEYIYEPGHLDGQCTLSQIIESNNSTENEVTYDRQLCEKILEIEKRLNVNAASCASLEMNMNNIFSTRSKELAEKSLKFSSNYNDLISSDNKNSKLFSFYILCSPHIQVDSEEDPKLKSNQFKAEPTVKKIVA